MTYAEYMSIAMALDPSLKASNADFFSDEEKEEIARMKELYG
jgi:hypothetical protein